MNDEQTAQPEEAQTPPTNADGKATGPRTGLGKRRASQNSLRSGIFSRATLLKAESCSEHQSLNDGLWNALQPGNELEEFLVDKLMSIIWHHRRVLLAEGAEIRKSSKFLEFDRRQEKQKEAEDASQRLQLGAVIGVHLEPFGLIWTINNPDVSKCCIELLFELRRGINTNGFNKMQDYSILKRIYGDPSIPHLRKTLQDECTTYMNIAEVAEAERESKGYAAAAPCRKIVLQKIDAEIIRLQKYERNCESIESERTKVEILRQSVPESRGMDRLLRYEAHLSREFDRTLSQLERLQRMRKGQPVLPPVKVDLSL